MTCPSDVYLPGIVRHEAGGWRLDHEHGTVPITDPEGLLDDGDDGAVRTVGLAVTWNEVEETTDAPHLRTDGHGAVLVGEPSYQPAHPADRTVDSFHRLSFDPGIWPGEASVVRGYGPTKAEPLQIDDAFGRSDPVRIHADELRVVEVFADGRDPYAGPVDGFRVEFNPDGEAVRLSVPGVPLWTTDGWHQYDPGAALELLGDRLRALLAGEEPSRTSLDGLCPELSLEDDRVCMTWTWVEHRLGLWPPDGLAVDRETFVRGWLRDARLYDDWFDGDLTDLRAEIREVTGLEPARDRRPAREPEAFERAELERIAREEPERRRDAVRALWLRTERASVSALSALREESGLDPADEPVLVGTLEAIGRREAIATLTETIRSASSSGATRRAMDYLEDAAVEHSRLLAAALVGGSPDEDLLDPLTDRLEDESPAVRALAARTLVSLAGAAVFDDLLDALLDEPDPTVRDTIASSLRRADPEAAERANVGILADRDDGPAQRRRLLDWSLYGGVSDREAVVEALSSDDVDELTVAMESVRAFTADPPYGPLIDRLADCDDYRESEYRDACRLGVVSLRRLIEAEASGPPPVDALIPLLWKDPVQAVARDALADLAKDSEGGDIQGVDPGRIHRSLFRTQSGNAGGNLEQLAAVVAATLAAFDPADFSFLRRENDRRRVLDHLVDRVGADALPMLTDLADGSDEALARTAQYRLREYPESVPLDLDVDLARNARALLLYKRVANRAIEEGNDERAAAVVERIADETLAGDWPARATGAAVLGQLTAVKGVREQLSDLASGGNTVVRAVATFCLQFCDLPAVEEPLVAVATDADAATITRRFALTALKSDAAAVSTEVLDRLQPVTDFPPRVQPTAHQLLVEAGRRDEDDDPPGEGLVDLGSPEIETPDYVVASLRGIVRDGNAEERAVALERLQEAYARKDEVEVTDVLDPMREALANDESDRVRTVAAIMLVLCHHRRAFEALREAGDETVRGA